VSRLFYYVANPLTFAEQRQAKFDLGISLILSSWQALIVAVQNNWGGNESSDKRDWFAGALSELFVANPATDAQDVEDVLLQVMEDEFEVELDDGSETIVAEAIMQLREETRDGFFGTVDKLWEQWNSRKQKLLSVVDAGPGSESGDSVDDEDEDDEDVEMTDAPAPSRQRVKAAPEIDEDGFTKVVSKKKNGR
jgi:pre-rRNA-processing protein TSR2